MIILNEVGSYPSLPCQKFAIKTLKEKATLVAKYFRLDDENFRKGRCDDLH